MGTNSFEKYVGELALKANGKVVSSAKGAKAIGEHDDGTDLPFEHILFPPLSYKLRDEIEARHGRRIPDEYFDVLTVSNGGILFNKSLILLGYPHISDTFGQPIDFIYDDVYSRPKSVPNDWFAIGGYPISNEQNSLLMMAASGDIHMLAGNNKVCSWDGLFNFLNYFEVKQSLS